MYATLTAKGKRALAQARPVHIRGVAEHFGRHLSEEEAKTVAAALGRMVSSPDGEDTDNCTHYLDATDVTPHPWS